MATPTTPLPPQQAMADDFRAAAADPAHDDADRIAYAFDAYLAEHPEACATAADYPGWTCGAAAAAKARYALGAWTPDGLSEAGEPQ